MHKINLHCPKCMFKGKLLKRQCWLRPLVHLKRCHFLILWSILLKIVANCAKTIAFNNNTQMLCRYVEICRKNKPALPVYFLLPLSIYILIRRNHSDHDRMNSVILSRDSQYLCLWYYMNVACKILKTTVVLMDFMVIPRAHLYTGIAMIVTWKDHLNLYQMFTIHVRWCVLRWLIRSILALNCLFKTQQVSSEDEDWCWSTGSGFALFALLFTLADSLGFFVIICTLSDKATPLCTIFCSLFPGLCWYVEILKRCF